MELDRGQQQQQDREGKNKMENAWQQQSAEGRQPRDLQQQPLGECDKQADKRAREKEILREREGGRER